MIAVLANGRLALLPSACIDAAFPGIFLSALCLTSFAEPPTCPRLQLPPGAKLAAARLAKWLCLGGDPVIGGRICCLRCILANDAWLKKSCVGQVRRY